MQEMGASRTLRILLEQNGMMNLISAAFATLLYLRTHRGFIEVLFLCTCYSGLIADILLVFTDGPSSTTITSTRSVRAMTFFEVVLWTIRELGLTLYTNRLVKVLDVDRREKLYYYGYNAMFALLLAWRLFDSGWRTYDRNSETVIVGSYVYLGALSAMDLWSSMFLLKSSVHILHVLNPELDGYKIGKVILFSGVLRIVFINAIPLVRLIGSLTIASVFNYQNDVSIILYYLQTSMNIMYLIDLSIIKIESTNIFKHNERSL